MRCASPSVAAIRSWRELQRMSVQPRSSGARLVIIAPGFTFLSVRGVSSCSSLGWRTGWPDLYLGGGIPDDIIHD